MSVFILALMSIDMQYLCSVALMLICVLMGFLLLTMRPKRSDKPQESDEKLPEEPEPVPEEPSEEAEPEGFSEEAESMEEPMEESIEEPMEEATEEVAEEEMEDEEIVILPTDTNFVRGRYNRSFTAKLMQSSDEVKKYYADLACELLSYERARGRMSWANSSFCLGRRAISKFAIRGKTLYLYLALDPKRFLGTKYFVTDESIVKRYEGIPLRMKIKSPRGVAYGKELIEILMREMGAARLKERADSVRADDFPFLSTQDLLQRGLIKLAAEGSRSPAEADRPVETSPVETSPVEIAPVETSPVEMSPVETSPVETEFETRETVSVSEVGDLIPDEVAVSMIEETEEEEEAVLPRPKGIINIDSLSENYEEGETVTLRSLKEKGLIARSVNYVKVLARGVLNKPLIVKLPEFSVDAVKMILLTGGKVIRVKTRN